jgi:hypothetical protein
MKKLLGFKYGICKLLANTGRFYSFLAVLHNLSYKINIMKNKFVRVPFDASGEIWFRLVRLRTL